MKAYKLFVIDKEESRRVQEKAFRLGYEWVCTGPVVSNARYLFIAISDDGFMSCWDEEEIEDFLNAPSQYITVPDFLALEEPEPKAPSHEEIEREQNRVILARYKEELNTASLELQEKTVAMKEAEIKKLNAEWRLAEVERAYRAKS